MAQHASDVQYVVAASLKQEYGERGPPGRRICDWHSVGYDVFEIVGHTVLPTAGPIVWIRAVGWARDREQLDAMLATRLREQAQG